MDGINESSFEGLAYGSQVDRNIAQVVYHTPVNSVNPYVFMDHAYFGSGGFRDGSYLIPFSRECAYKQRKELSHYKNYVRPIVRAMVEPVFNDPAERAVKDISGTDLNQSMYNIFLDDVDSAGTDMQQFAHKAVSICRRHGVVFVVMDNYPTTAQPETVSQALEGRIMPYIYVKQAHEVHDYETDPFGNLKTITFTDTPEKRMVNGKPKYEERYREWTENESIVYGKDKNGNLTVISRSVHGLGVVPVIMEYADIVEDMTIILPYPPLYDIAKLNHVIYNQSAEIRDQERAQAFSIFYVQGVPPGDLSIGNNTYINLPTDVTIAPGYASPDFNIIAGLVKNQDQIRQDLFSIAEQNGVVGVQSSKSGIAMQWDFWAHESVLLKTASIATSLEYKIADLFKLYTNENFVYTVSYSDDYAPMGIDNEIARIDKLLRIPGINKKFANKVQEKLARLVLYDIDETELSDVVNDIVSDTGDVGVIMDGGDENAEQQVD
jgi:hypothetical protein